MIYMKRASLSLLILLFALCISAQSNIYALKEGNSNRSFVLLTQDEINAIPAPANGFICINTTSNCINYFSNNQWFELCGECMPKINFTPSIDTVFTEYSSLFIKFKSLNIDTSTQIVVLLLPDSMIMKSQHSEFVFTNLENGTYSVVYYLQNKCGMGPISSYNRIHINSAQVCTDSIVTFNKNEYTIHSFEKSCWYTSDVKEPTTLSFHLSNTNNYYYAFNTVENSKLCPDGWHIANSNDANSLLSLFAKNKASISTFKLNYVGSYLDKKIINEGVGNTYWLVDKGSKNEKLFIVSSSGGFIVDVTGQNAYATVRCVRD